MLLLTLSSAFAVLTRKTVLPRRMFVLHMPTWQIIFVLIPDIRKLAGAEVSTMDFVLSQDSGNAALLITAIGVSYFLQNAALLIWMTANAIWAGAEHPEMDMEMEM